MKNIELPVQKMYWNGGFSDEPTAGAVEISWDCFVSLIEGQEQGKRIVSDNNGYPVLVEQEPTPDVPPASPEPTEIELSMMGAIAELYELTLK